MGHPAPASAPMRSLPRSARAGWGRSTARQIRSWIVMSRSRYLPESLAGDPGRIARSQREASVDLYWKRPHNLVASARINPPILTPTAARVAFRVTLQASNPSSERALRGMGEVYRATDTKLDRDVAIKVLPESLAGDPGRIARSQREASVALLENPPGQPGGVGEDQSAHSNAHSRTSGLQSHPPGIQSIFRAALRAWRRLARRCE